MGTWFRSKLPRTGLYSQGTQGAQAGRGGVQSLLCLGHVGAWDLGLREQRRMLSEWVTPPCLGPSSLPTPFPQEKGRKCLKDTPPHHEAHVSPGQWPAASSTMGWRHRMER